MLATVSHLAVLELEDDAVGNIEVLAVSVRCAAQRRVAMDPGVAARQRSVALTPGRLGRQSDLTVSIGSSGVTSRFVSSTSCSAPGTFDDENVSGGVGGVPLPHV